MKRPDPGNLSRRAACDRLGCPHWFKALPVCAAAATTAASCTAGSTRSGELAKTLAWLDAPPFARIQEHAEGHITFAPQSSHIRRIKICTTIQTDGLAAKHLDVGSKVITAS